MNGDFLFDELVLNLIMLSTKFQYQTFSFS